MKRPLPNLLVQGFQLACAIGLCGLGLRRQSCLWPARRHTVRDRTGPLPGPQPGRAKNCRHHRRQPISASWRCTSASPAFFPIAIHTAVWLNLLQLLVLFVLFAGTVFVYVSAEPPRLSVLLRGGVAYFWRFVRAAILAGCIAGSSWGFCSARAACWLGPAQFTSSARCFFTRPSAGPWFCSSPC
jgi:hypothetical protein